MSIKIEIKPYDDQVSVRFLVSEKAVDVSAWHSYKNKIEIEQLSLLLDAIDEGTVSSSDKSVLFVSHEWISALSNLSAKHIALPPPVPFVFCLENSSNINDKNFKIKYEWRDGGLSLSSKIKRKGAWLYLTKSSGNKEYRLNDNFYKLCECVDKINNNCLGLEDRIPLLNELQSYLPDKESGHIEVDSYISKIRIYPAHSFTLNVGNKEDLNYIIDPVLICAENSYYPKGMEDITDTKEEKFKLIPQSLQKRFLDEFTKKEDVKKYYVGGDNQYIVLNEELKKALRVVKKVRNLPAKQQMDFLRSPVSWLKSEMDDNIGDENIENIFVETENYSKRIKGIGLWQPKVLPYLKSNKISWFNRENDDYSDLNGIILDGEILHLTNEEAMSLYKDIQKSIEDGKPFAEYKGYKVPANDDTKESLKAVIKESTIEEQQAKEDDKDLKPAHVVLLTKDNLEDLEFVENEESEIAKISSFSLTNVKTQLKKHQEQGVRWLQSRFIKKLKGAILADDMGLGKTLQALAFLSWLRDRVLSGEIEKAPFLIVAPTGLLQNWNDEIEKHLYEHSFGEILHAYGSSLKNLKEKKGKEIEDGATRINRDRLNSADCILTTYETLRDYHHSFALVKFLAVVFDEAQKIKNPAAVMSSAAKTPNKEFCIAMTGTPIENRLIDLWSIADTVSAGVLGSAKHFTQKYESDNASESNLESLKKGLCQNLSSLDDPSKIPALILRRMKEDELDGLPRKNVVSKEKAMTDFQAGKYKDAISKGKFIEKNSTDGKARKEGNYHLEILSNIRNISLHPDINEKSKSTTAFIEASARLVVTMEILDSIYKKKEKAIIFLENLDFQEILREILFDRYSMNKKPYIINGRVDGTKRKNYVDMFQKSEKGFDVMILSPKAGGVGLTLTAANHVIHLTRWWNPAVEDQCTDRIYRIGQEKDIYVYYPKAIYPLDKESSFDLKIDELLSNKRALSKNFLGYYDRSDDDEISKQLFDSIVSNTKI